MSSGQQSPNCKNPHCPGRQPPRATQNRLLTELETISTANHSGYCAGPKGDNLYEWVATVFGPEDSPYVDGVFFIELSIPKNYPYVPPKAKFLTRVYHWNVDAAGMICLDLLQTDWRPSLTIADALGAIRHMLVDKTSPKHPDNTLVPAIAQRYESDRDGFWRTAVDWTHRYAS